MIIVTDHPAVKDLMLERGLALPNARIVQRCYDDNGEIDLTGEIVICTSEIGPSEMPLHLAMKAQAIYRLELPDEFYGQNVTLQQMRNQAGDAPRVVIPMDGR